LSYTRKEGKWENAQYAAGEGEYPRQISTTTPCLNKKLVRIVMEVERNFSAHPLAQNVADQGISGRIKGGCRLC
jgi:hypothetical protein